MNAEDKLKMDSIIFGVYDLLKGIFKEKKPNKNKPNKNKARINGINRKKVYSLHDKGLTVREISEDLEVSKPSIYKALKERPTT